MNLLENIKLALRAIRDNLLRTVLTFSIIAIGITALVGILTATDCMEATINQNFTSMGANTFTVRNWGRGVRAGHGGGKPRRYGPIRYQQALDFKRRYFFPSRVSISAKTADQATVKYQNEKTNPNVGVYGVDDEYIDLSAFEFSEGRNFSDQELYVGSDAIILGSDVKRKVFGDEATASGKMVSLGNRKYRVAGVLQPRGASMMTNDNMVLIPLQNARRAYSMANESFTISVAVHHPKQLDAAISEATGLMRSIRKLRLGEMDNFDITRSDNLATLLIDNLKYVTVAAAIIGAITLLGAAIGLMNIMLVSIAERTREIGISKSLGATKAVIRNQFLTEALVICQIGGILGIFFGILIGNLVALWLGGPFVTPWQWILAGIAVCFVVGLASGIYPAIKAAKLDPIEALRFE